MSSSSPSSSPSVSSSLSTSSASAGANASSPDVVSVPDHLIAAAAPAVVAPDGDAVREALHLCGQHGMPASAPKEELLKAAVQATHHQAVLTSWGPTVYGSQTPGSPAATETQPTAATDDNASQAAQVRARTSYTQHSAQSLAADDQLAERIYAAKVDVTGDGKSQQKLASQSKQAASAYRSAH